VLSLAAAKPDKSTLNTLMTNCIHEAYPAKLSVVVYAQRGSPEESTASAQRAFRGMECPSRVVGFSHPRGLTWEEGCIHTFDEGAIILRVRRGNAIVSVDYEGKVIPGVQQICREIAQLRLETLDWED
jgi:hypothetical protein